MPLLSPPSPKLGAGVQPSSARTLLDVFRALIAPPEPCGHVAYDLPTPTLWRPIGFEKPKLVRGSVMPKYPYSMEAGHRRGLFAQLTYYDVLAPDSHGQLERRHQRIPTYVVLTCLHTKMRCPY